MDDDDDDDDGLMMFMIMTNVVLSIHLNMAYYEKW